MGLDNACLTCREYNFVDPEDWDVQALIRQATRIVVREASRKSEERLALANIVASGNGSGPANKEVNRMLKDLNRVAQLGIGE